MGDVGQQRTLPYEAKAWRSWSRETAKIATIMNA